MRRHKIAIQKMKELFKEPTKQRSKSKDKAPWKPKRGRKD
jgi:hypothetical protein